MAVKVRRLTDDEGCQLQRIVRRGGGGREKSVVRWRRAMIVLASAGGNAVPVIARLVQTSDDRVREVIHAFNELGLDCLDPKWAGGRPRRIEDDDRAFIVKVAKKRPRSLGQPFTRWSLAKLCGYLAKKKGRKVQVSEERLRQILHEEGVSFQKTRSWKESPDPMKEAKLARIEAVILDFPDRTFAFDEFGPVTCEPQPGSGWAPKKRPQRRRANYHKTEGTRQFYACYSLGDDELWGHVRPHKSAAFCLAALNEIRQRRPDSEWIYVILDNLNSHRTKEIRAWCDKNNVELCFTPTYGSWANPIEAHFGPLREFVIRGSDYRNHRQFIAQLHKYLRWRNANADDPAVIVAMERERARVRGDRQQRMHRLHHQRSA